MQDPAFLESIFQWLEGSSLAIILRQSHWVYPAVEIIHIAGFALLVGAAILFDLRLLGLSRKLPVKASIGHLIYWARISLIAVIPSGLLLFIVEATSLASNSAFQIKLILIAAAGLNATIFHRFTLKTVDEWNIQAPAPPAARIAGLLSILLWLGVIACGRLIAYV